MLAADIWVILLVLVAIAVVLHFTRLGRSGIEARVERLVRRIIRSDRDRTPPAGDTPE
ncbi:MAG: hypothetical protein ACTHNU_12500 [Gaiellales bacterium]